MKRALIIASAIAGLGVLCLPIVVFMVTCTARAETVLEYEARQLALEQHKLAQCEAELERNRRVNPATFWLTERDCVVPPRYGAVPPSGPPSGSSQRLRDLERRIEQLENDK